MLAQLVIGGVVSGVVVLPDGSILAAGGASWTDPGGVTHVTPGGAILMAQAGAQAGWALSGGVLVAPAATPATATQLRAYAGAKADALRAVARSYTLAGGLVVMCDSTQGTGADLIGLNTWGAANPTATTNFVQDNGGVVTLTGAQCVALANAVLAYGQSVFAVLATAMNDIANGMIATTAQIDALSWPT